MRYLFQKTTSVKSFNKSAGLLSVMMAFGVLFLLMGPISSFAQTTIYYVDKDATGNNLGTSWEHAFNELQDIPGSVSGSYEVWVAEGTYKPTTGNDQTASFNIPGNVTILGGFDGTETAADQRNWQINKTIVSGDLDDSGTANAGDSHSIITIVNSDNVTIDGFIIENSFANNDAENSPLAIGRAGAGIYARYSDNLNINNCIFHHNVAHGNGTDSGVGGAMINFGDESTTTTITNTLFFENTATGGGGAISGESGSIELISSTIADNIAGHGGGVHFYNSSVSAVNSIFTNNSGANGNMNNGGGSGSGTITYSMLYNIYGAGGQLPDNITDGGNNIYETDPLYNSGGNIEGYRLLQSSPAIDKGDNTSNNLDKDLAAQNRIQDGDSNNTTIIDLGAFEVPKPFFNELPGVGIIGVQRSSVDWGDYDNDGDLDILLTGENGSPFSKIYTNDNGNFTELGAGLIGVYESSASWGDYDNDGDLDILLTGQGSTTADRISKIYTNNNGVFDELTGAGLEGVEESNVAWGDYDNDGDLDILLTGIVYYGIHYEGISKIYTNNGDGTFTELTGVGLTGVHHSSVAWGDYDNDGDLDILLTGDARPGWSNSGPQRTSKIYTNNNNGSFTELTGAELTGVRYSSASWGDYDSDGDLDILLTGESNSGIISKIYTNDGDGTFTELEGAGLIGVLTSSTAWGDYDNDGDLDILLTGMSDNGSISTIYTNNNGSFTELSGSGLIDVSSSSTAWGDYDNDGDLDILLTGLNGSERNAKIYRNTSVTANTPPTAPSNITATPNNDKGRVDFSWDTATDNETPGEGLSYNVFIKENPSGTPEYRKSPMAQENDGWRKLPALGNAMQNTSYTWNIPETYCGGTVGFAFRVQAIDHAYAGSEFSAETSFSIDLTMPLYVDASATGGNDGSDWTNAFTHLQDALNHACFAGEIWVAQGMYKPGTDQTDSFEIPEGITLLGGFDGTETTANERNWAEHPTILSGDLDESGDASNGDHFQVVRILNDDVTIDGFIIENAYNNDTRLGAGVYNEGDNTTIKNSIIRDNTAEGNSENGIGGGLSNIAGNTELINCLFYNNTAWNYGGAIDIEGDAVTLTNCTITNNDALEEGGAVHFYNGSLNATNTIFADNSAPVNGNINDDGGSGAGTLNYSLVYNGDVSSAITQTNPITGDPLFTDVTSHDFTLQESSPAVDAGDNQLFADALYGSGGSLTGAEVDLAGNTRIYSETSDPDVVDIGAYEFQGEPQVDHTLTLTVGEGWRMLSSPVAGQSYADMLDPLWTQGVPGSDYEGDSNTFPNVYTWDLTSPDTCLEEEECPEWIAPSTGFENAIPAGSGFLMYVFADDDYDEGTIEGFSKTLSLTGTRHSGDVSPDINTNPNGWTLVGTPYDEPIDFNGLGKTDLTDIAYIYDPNATGITPAGPTNGNGGAWRSTDGTYGDITDGVIAPGQGFFVQTASSPSGTPSLTFSESDQTSGGEFYGKQAEPRDYVRLEINGESGYNSVWVRFSSEGSLEKTTGEALELQPLDAGYTLLAVRKTGGTLLDIAHYPLDTKNLQIPLAVETTQSGAFTLSATDVDIPAGMNLYLYDRQTGQSLPIGQDFEYEFELHVEKAKKNSPLERGQMAECLTKPSEVCPRVSQPIRPVQAGKIHPMSVTTSHAVSQSSTHRVNSGRGRFLITTSPDGDGTELPNEVDLGQNYPNPFNPSTIISYQLPARSLVRLEVFDLIGRQVATLVDGAVEAGRHQVNFNAEHLTSGVYLYRLQTDNKIITKKLTLIK